VRLDATNTRMKDFFDLWFMSSRFDVDMLMLKKAVHATCERRGTTLPLATPHAFTPAFAVQKEQAWKQFLKRNNLSEPCGSFGGLITYLSDKLGSIWQ
jgi:hypothetical protein